MFVKNKNLLLSLSGFFFCGCLFGAAPEKEADAKRKSEEERKAEVLERNIVYKARPYGFESIFNPVTISLNAGIEQIQFNGGKRNIFKFDYATSSSNVWKNVSRPVGPISRLGWGRFFKTEVFPISFSKDEAQWWPNYSLHLFGGGLTGRGLTEWYDYHGFSHPWIWSFVNYQAYQWLNEIYENGKFRGDNTDAIADMWIFNNIGFALFAWDPFAKFFVDTLNFADWSPQPMFLVNDATLQNNSQRFTMKYFFPWTKRWALFYHFGTTGMLGLTHKLEHEYAVSVAGGFQAKRLKTVRTQGRVRTADLTWTAGMFIDRGNTPLLSLTASAFYEDLASLNIYPGLMRFGNFSFGMAAGLKTDDKFFMGLSTIYTPGIGFRN